MDASEVFTYMESIVLIINGIYLNERKLGEK